VIEQHLGLVLPDKLGCLLRDLAVWNLDTKNDSRPWLNSGIRMELSRIGSDWVHSISLRALPSESDEKELMWSGRHSKRRDRSRMST
jgi:hypothetical protein